MQISLADKNVKVYLAEFEPNQKVTAIIQSPIHENRTDNIELYGLKIHRIFSSKGNMIIARDKKDELKIDNFKTTLEANKDFLNVVCFVGIKKVNEYESYLTWISLVIKGINEANEIIIKEQFECDEENIKFLDELFPNWYRSVDAMSSKSK